MQLGATLSQLDVLHASTEGLMEAAEDGNGTGTGTG